MASVNKVILVGNLGNDPEVKYMPSGGAVTNISIATTDNWTDKSSGQKQERTEWHRVVFFNRQAEVIGEYMRKGSQIYIEGRLQTRKWQDQGGQDRWSTEIVAQNFQFLGGRQGAGGDSGGSYGGGQGSAPSGGGNQGGGQPPSPPQQGAPAPQQGAPQSGGAPKQSTNFDDFEDDIPF